MENTNIIVDNNNKRIFKTPEYMREASRRYYQKNKQKIIEKCKKRYNEKINNNLINSGIEIIEKSISLL